MVRPRRCKISARVYRDQAVQQFAPLCWLPTILHLWRAFVASGSHHHHNSLRWGITSSQGWGANHLTVQRLKATIPSYSSSCFCSACEGCLGRPAELGWVCSLGHLDSPVPGWAGLELSPWGSSAHVFLIPLLGPVGQPRHALLMEIVKMQEAKSKDTSIGSSLS